MCRWQSVGDPGANGLSLSWIQTELLQQLRASRCLVGTISFPQAFPLPPPPGHLLFLLLFPTSSNSLFLPLLHFLLYLLFPTAVLLTPGSAYLYPKGGCSTEDRDQALPMRSHLSSSPFCRHMLDAKPRASNSEAWPLLSPGKSHMKKDFTFVYLYDPKELHPHCPMFFYFTRAVSAT